MAWGSTESSHVSLLGRKSLTLASSLLCVLLGSGFVSAQSDVWVDDDDPACSDLGPGTQAVPFCTVQAAICDLKDLPGGGTVNVEPGYYNESLRLFAGISVVSTDGPAVTTVDATGAPCVKSDCSLSTSNLTCAVVVYGQGSATNSDRLEGLRLTGGSGLFRDFGGGEPAAAVAGGGIFVFGASPTITDNEIVDNVLFSSGTKYFWGGGIYLGGGTYNYPTQPTITNNLIQGNIAIPPPGGLLPPPNPYGEYEDNDGLGGGIYVGYHTAPVIDSNTIRSNQAGDQNTKAATGGGIVVYSISPTIRPRISQNLIQDNQSNFFGGGIFFSYLFDTTGVYPNQVITFYPTQGVVEGNLIELNRSFSGGGAMTSLTMAEFVNNTIVDNTADFGGGFTAAASVDPLQQATLSNNIVAFNTALLFGGGGVAVSGSEPLIKNNDIFGNQPNDVGGEKSDLDYIGLDGNLSQDPLFVSRIPGSRDLRIQAGSPLIDAAENTLVTVVNDLAGVPRIQDGDTDGADIVDIGAGEFSPDSD